MRLSRSSSGAVIAVLVVTLGTWLRLANIGDLEPHVDESGNLLTSIDLHFREIVAPGELCRPLLGMLFRLVPTFASLAEVDSLTAARAQGAIVGVLTALILGLVVWREFSASAGLMAMTVWLLCPLSVVHERLVLQDQYTAFIFSFVCLVLSFAGDLRRGIGEVGSFFVVGGLVGIGVANKLTALCDVPWLIAFGLCVWERREQRVDLIRVFSPALLGFVLVTYGAGWAPPERIILRLQNFSYHLPALGNSFSILRGGLFLPCSLVYYAGIWGATALLLGMIFARGAGKRWVLLTSGVLSSIVLYGIAYSQTAYFRYALPLFVPVAVVSAVGWARLLVEVMDRRLWWLLGVVLGVVGLYWISGILGIIRNPLRNRWSEARALPSDYEMYTLSWWSGNGLATLFGVGEGLAPRPIFVVAGGWHTSSNGLYLKCFESRTCSVRRLGERQNDAAFVLDAWERGRGANEKVILIGDDSCKFGDARERCRGTLIADRPGIELKSHAPIPRMDGVSLFRIAELVGSTRSELAMESQPPYADGFLAPRAIMDLGSEFAAARAVRIRGEMVPGISRLDVAAEVSGTPRGESFLEGGEVSFEIPLEGIASSMKREVRLSFDDWVVLPDTTAVHDGYWGGSRAVSLRLLGVEPVFGSR